MEEESSGLREARSGHGVRLKVTELEARIVELRAASVESPSWNDRPALATSARAVPT